MHCVPPGGCGHHFNFVTGASMMQEMRQFFPAPAANGNAASSGARVQQADLEDY
jgi:hypothetical protein